jgi:hypothetical protein
MRVQGVTGDLPAIAHVGPVAPPVVPPVDDAPPRPAVAAPSAGEGAELGDGSAADDHRRRPLQPLPSFDPPLIAQRAVLGWPVGPLVVEHVRATGVSYGAVWAQVDRAMAAVQAKEPPTGA